MHPSPTPNPATALRAGHRRRTLRIAVERILARSGPGHFDDASETLIDLLQQCCGDRGYRAATGIDASHPNPWFHAWMLPVDDGPADLAPHASATAGIAEVSYRAFVRKVAELGLEPQTD